MPPLFNQLSKFIQHHLPIHDLSKHTFTLVGYDCYKICTRLRIIISL